MVGNTYTEGQILHHSTQPKLTHGVVVTVSTSASH